MALEGDHQWTGSQLHLAWNPTLLVSCCWCNKLSQTYWLKINTFTLFLLLRSEIQNQSYENQGDHRAGSPKRRQRTVSFLASSNLYKQKGMWPSLAPGHLAPSLLPHHTSSSAITSPSGSLLQGQLGLCWAHPGSAGLSLPMLFNLITSAKSPLF